MISSDTTLEHGSTQFESNSFRPWVVCLSAALFFFYEFIQMHMFNSISPSLMRSFSVDAVSLGYLSSTYLYADVCFLLPAGLILDRFSTRRVILTSMTLCIGGTFGFALSSNVLVAGLFHFMSGIGNAFCFLSCIMLTTRWFAPERRALVVGVIVTMAMVGGVVAQTPLAMLAASVGWRHALIIDTVLGLAIMTLIWQFVYDYPEGYKAQFDKLKSDSKDIGFFKSLFSAMKNTQNWLCGIYTSLLNLPIMLLGALWGDLFLNQVHHLSIRQATVATSMLFFGTIIGSPLVGWISDTIRTRRMPMIIGAVFSLLIMCFILYVPQMSMSVAILSFFALGFFTSTQVLAYPMVTESNRPAITGTAMGLTSLLIMGGAAVAQPLFGYFMQMGWDHQVVDGVRQYSALNFHNGLVMIPISFVIGLLAVLMARETHCKPYGEQS